jgi:nucleoside-diphosphate-sugar epimerase
MHQTPAVKFARLREIGMMKYRHHRRMMSLARKLPDTIRDLAHLEDLLSTPSDAAIQSLRNFDGHFIILGAAGKMGPSLSRMIRRGLDALGKAATRVIAVSRFSTPAAEQDFNNHGVETIKADLLNPQQLAALPDAPNIVYMAGMKFGSTNQEALTWAMNVYLPGMVCQRYRTSRIVAFASGNIYGLSDIHRGGSLETDPLNPLGDYAMSVLGRERILEHFSRALNIPIAIIRLNYAVEMRYGVLHDLAARVDTAQPIDLSMGHANVIWQGDANAMSIAAFDRAASPPFILNVAGPELLSVRQTAEEFGRLLGKQPTLIGNESPTALLSNGHLGHRLYGLPRVPARQVLTWTADWIKQGGVTLNKPTHFEARDGKF